MSSSTESTSLPVYGTHTLVPGLVASTELHEHVPALSEGRLPPYLIVVGDRTRVKSAAALLDNPVDLSELMMKHQHSPKRVAVLVGSYKGTPVAFLEHGMGCASAEILVREALHPDNMRTQVRGLDGRRYHADARYVVRVGSAAGINPTHPRAGQVLTRPFDLVVCSHQVGVSNTCLQSLTGVLNPFDKRLLSAGRTRLVELGYSMEKDKVHDAEVPVLRVDETLSGQLTTHAQQLASAAVVDDEEERTQVHQLGNVCKDSLYAEAEEEEFQHLRDQFDAGSSEMEFSTIARVARQYTLAGQPVKAGMILMLLGTIPGSGFVYDDKRQAVVRHQALVAALEALHSISQGHIVEE